MSERLMKLIVPPHTIEWFPAGEHCHNAVDGDLMLVDHGSWEDVTIELAQLALTFSEPDLRGFDWCAHTAIIRGEIDGRTAVSEMGPSGYERRQLYDYKAHLYAIVHFDVTDEQVATAVSYDEACAGLEYGWAQYPPIILDGMTGALLSCQWGDTIICSTHATMVLMGLGLFPDRPPQMVVPARMARWVGASKISTDVPTQIILIPGTPRPN